MATNSEGPALYPDDELNKAMTDGDWPHQVQLPVYRCVRHNYRSMDCLLPGAVALSPYARNRRDAGEMTVSCFADREHAKKCGGGSGGELIDPATRPSQPQRRVCLCAERRCGTAAASIATTD